MGGSYIRRLPTPPPVILIACHRFDAYQKAAEQFTISQAYLTRKENADVEIDRVLTDCLTLVRHIVLARGRDLLTRDHSCTGTAGVSLPSHRYSLREDLCSEAQHPSQQGAT